MADEIWVDDKIFQIPYRLNYLDFTMFDISALFL